jgi:hypothetical protein
MTATVDARLAVVESNETNNSATGSYVVPVNGPFDFVPVHNVAALNPTLPTETVSFVTGVGNVGIYTGFTTVTVTDALPVGFTLDSWSSTGLGVNCSPAGDPATGLVVTCTGVPNSVLTATSPPGTVTVVARPPTATGIVDYTASDVVTVDADQAVFESNTINDTATATVHISNDLPDLALDMTTSPDPVDPGGVITEMLTVSNVGTASAATSQVRFTALPGTFIGVAYSGVGCGKASVTRGSYVIACGVLDLAPGASVTFPVQFTASGLIGTYTASAFAGVTSGRSFSGPESSSSTSSSVVINGPVDLVPTVTMSASPLTAGQALGIAISVDNTGIGQSAATAVLDVLPDGFSLVPSTPADVAAGTGTTATCSAVGQVVTCPVGALPPHGRVDLFLVATAAPTAGAFTNTVTVDPDALVAESDETNNVAIQSGTVVLPPPLADLATSISAPTSVASNSKPSFTATLSNVGPGVAVNPVWVTSVPGFSKVDSVVAPAGFTCTAQQVKSTTSQGNQVVCTAASLDPGAGVTVRITVSGAFTRGVTSISSTAVLTAPEVTTTNNRAVVTLTVT